MTDHDPNTEDKAARVQAFVGENFEYYSKKWETFADASGAKVRFNIAAAIFSTAWLLYRKLYAAFAILCAVITVDIAISSYLEASEIVASSTIRAWDNISTLLYGLVIGTWGNYWYYRKFTRVNELSRNFSVDLTAQKEFLSKRGGTSLVLPFVLIVVIFAMVFWPFQ